MTDDQQPSWPTQQFADERALVRRDGDVSALFGLGPAEPASPPDLRMKRVCEFLKPTLLAIRWGEQIHGRVIASIAPEPGKKFISAACVGRCDGLMTSEPGIGLVVWTADCVPVLMAGDGVVAAIHAGWRGAAEDIVGAAVQRFHVEYGVEASRIRTFLGPSISGPQYEVGKEVIDALKQLGTEEGEWRDGNCVDLRAFLASRLVVLGLERAAISSVGPCTASSPHLASFRRDGTGAGRQFSLIYRAAS